ncbi:MAG: HD domain-containing protein [Saprospiraceae bacterium]
MNYKALKTYILNKLEKELLPVYTYHGIHHTLDVLKVTNRLCKAENVSESDTLLLKTAVLLHDLGFTISPKEHESTGCDIARKLLPEYNYTPDDIEIICGMIMATKIPQDPHTHLEQVICDADLDYLGRNDFFTIGRTLYDELLSLGVIHSEYQWNTMQLNFLEKHHYHTKTTIRLREARKQKHLQSIKNLL